MSTAESFRKDVADRIQVVLSSSNPLASTVFPNCLSAEERKYIHKVAENFGLRHVSSGQGDARRITVTKDPEKGNRRGLAGHGQRPGRLRLPATAWEALAHPLVQHAAERNRQQALLDSSAVQPGVGLERIDALLGAREDRPAPSSSDSGFAPGQGPPESALRLAREALPAWTVRDRVLTAAANHRVVLVAGATGCGKSTQVPQFLLEEASPSPNIIVTQPRRLSALGLAHRVAQERGEAVGKTVGYSVHLDHQASASTRLLFCTTGVFRRRLLAEPLLPGVTHLIFDELHEREKITDFLLIAVRDLLAKRSDLRVILMSATMEQDTFRKFFVDCAEVSILGRTFPVDELFLEDLAPNMHSAGFVQALGPGFAAGGLGYGTWQDRGKEKEFKCQVLVTRSKHPDGLNGYAQNARKPLSGKRLEEGLFLHDVLQQMKGVEFDLSIVEAILLSLSSGGPGAAANDTVKSGGVLVFLPGWDDINQLRKRFERHPELGDPKRFWILPLHSQIRLEQQRDVFKTPPKGVRKVILSTNIAETSITIDDVTVVIDCGRAKEVSYDSTLRVPTLNTSWVSRASIMQRAGRAGRTQPGVCYHLFSNRRAEMLDSHRPPEMLRSSLEDLCLHSKLLLARSGRSTVSAAEYLKGAPDPPPENCVRSSEHLLRDIGALTGSVDGPGELTALGVHLSSLPLLPQFAKTVFWANLLGVGNDALAVVSSLQYRDPFVSLVETPGSVRSAKQQLCASDESSDHVALLRAFDSFQAAGQRGGKSAERQFCEDHCLSFNQMTNLRGTCSKLRREFDGRGLRAELATRNEGNVALLIAALCAGLFPNVAKRTPSSKGGDRMQVSNGRLQAHPHTTSAVSSFVKGRQKEQWQDFSQTWQHVDEGGQVFRALGSSQGGGSDKLRESWYCFNELNQIEESYSLTGMSRVPISALLLLCGEGDLVIKEVSEETQVQADSGEKDPFDQWWSAATQQEASAGAAGDANASNGGAETADGKDEVNVSVCELGPWLSVQMSRDAAQRIQALRAMLRLLFRSYCSDPARLKDLAGEGKPGAVVMDLAARVICADLDYSPGTRAQPSAVQAVLGRGRSSGKAPAKAGTSGHQDREGNHAAVAAAGSSGRGRGSRAGRGQASKPGGRSAEEVSSGNTGIAGQLMAGRAQGFCQWCQQRVPATAGRWDPRSHAWYCERCWSTY